MEYLSLLLIDIKGFLKMVNIMDLVNILGLLEIFMRVIMKLDKKMDMEFIMELMVLSIKEIGTKVKDMVRVYRFIQMENKKE